MSALTNALNRIVACWEKNGNEKLVHDLMPGLSHAEIEELVQDLPIQLPQEIFELYQWRNGSKYEEDEGWYLPLQDAVKFYLNRIEYYEPPFNEGNVAIICLFFYIFPPDPVSEQVGYILIPESLDACPVIFETMNSEPSITRKYASITAMMLTIAELMETEIDAYKTEERYQIWRKYNISIVDNALAKLTKNICLQSLVEITIDLTMFKDSRAVEPLINLLEGSSLEVNEVEQMGIRALAADILGDSSDSRAVEPLINALQDEYQGTRYNAAISLGKFKDGRTIQPLIDALQDSDFDVRRAAAGSFVQQEAIEPLIKALNSNDRNVRFEASWALTRLRNPRGSEALSGIIEDVDPEVGF
ncbi:PBS lyase HEAT-like repeat protein [Calothrix parasitica NIES-267]|uniref:PBS lyase HEAT-like repeat protein n=1 Tax=Calothrix parasitica NIES-267 TaxID=1973488 RepID=A0A1Z4LQ90_9CYAN|nr:PBS lyase HEAT-like repeat protein [Calothrix parasitica NIES-267]